MVRSTGTQQGRYKSFIHLLKCFVIHQISAYEESRHFSCLNFASVVTEKCMLVVISKDQR